MIATARGTFSILPNGTVGTRPATCIAFTQAVDFPQIRAVCARVSIGASPANRANSLLGEFAHFLFESGWIHSQHGGPFPFG